MLACKTVSVRQFPIPPYSQQLPIRVLFLWIYLFWIFDRNGITVCDLCLTSLTACNVLRFILIAWFSLHSFLGLNNIPLVVYVTIYLSICLSLMDIWTIFHLFTIMNNAAINIHVQVSVWRLDFILIVSLPYLANKNTECPVKSESYISCCLSCC